VGAQSRTETLKRRALLLIMAALAIALIVYIAIELLSDLWVKASWTSGPLVSAIINFTKSATLTVRSWGYFGVFGLMLLEASSLPIPSEVILPFSGYLVSLGTLNFWITLTVATVAAIAGSLIDYYIGLKGIEALTKYRLLGRAVFNEDQIKVAAGWFSKYGALMVFLGRLIPGFRTIISFPAGAVKMPLTKFLGYTVAGCIVWNGILIYVGYYLGIKWREVADVSHYVIIVAVAALIAAALFYLIIRRHRRKKWQQAAQQKLA
jgi:membrane protein DedA with SNARE-associated domain